MDKLNRGEAFNLAKHSFDILNTKLDAFELVNKDPGYFIDDYFSDLINKIDLKREELKLDIDNFYDKHIEDLKSIKKECLEISEQHKNIANDEIKNLPIAKQLESYFLDALASSKINYVLESEDNGLVIKKSTKKKPVNGKWSIKVKEFKKRLKK